MSFRIIVKTPDALKPGAPAPGLQSIESGLVEMGQLIEREVKIRTPIGGMRLTRGSIVAEKRGNPIREVIIGAPFPADIVERGRRPGKPPPIGPILLWVEGKPDFRGERTKSTAYKIRAGIAKHGTKGAFMFERAVRESNPQLQQVAEKMGATIVNEAVSGK